MKSEIPLILGNSDNVKISTSLNWGKNYILTSTLRFETQFVIYFSLSELFLLLVAMRSWSPPLRNMKSTSQEQGALVKVTPLK